MLNTIVQLFKSKIKHNIANDYDKKLNLVRYLLLYRRYNKNEKIQFTHMYSK